MFCFFFTESLKWFDNWLTDRLIDLMTDGLIDWLIDWVRIGCLIYILTDCFELSYCTRNNKLKLDNIWFVKVLELVTYLYIYK